MQQRLQRFIGGCGSLDEDRLTAGAPVHAVQHQAVQVTVEIGSGTKALDQRDRAAVGLLGLQIGLIEQEARDGTVHDLQHRRHPLGLCSQQKLSPDSVSPVD